jgi:hypothetical protein
LKRGRFAPPFYPPENQGQNRVDFASQNATKVKPIKPSLFSRKKLPKKTHKKSRKFAVRKSAFLCTMVAHFLFEIGSTIG